MYLPTPLGQAPAFLMMLDQLSVAAQTDRPVLVIGERGTGKEMAAQRLHYLSSRWEGPLISMNCAALSETLLDAELFGHEAGAFTGAQKARLGRFERAHGGSLFLDEIATAAVATQEKLLRVIEYGVLERLGGQQEKNVSVRIIAATNCDLPSEVTAGRFRADLLDRLAFDVITLPPLRARREDIPLLAQHFAHQMAVELAWEEMPVLSEDFLMQLAEYDWPGNIRELRNVVGRAVVKADRGGEIRAIPLDPFESPWRPLPSAHHDQDSRPSHSKPCDEAAQGGAKITLPMDIKKQLHQSERDYVMAALAATQFHQKQAATQLGLSYHQFRHLLVKHQIEG